MPGNYPEESIQKLSFLGGVDYVLNRLRHVIADNQQSLNLMLLHHDIMHIGITDTVC